MSDLDEFLGDFRTESNEALDSVENQLLAMESGDKEAVNSVFRAFHSIKGGAAFLDLKQIRSLTHSLEDLLDQVRRGELRPEQDLTNGLLSFTDLIRNMLSSTDVGEGTDIQPALDRISKIKLSAMIPNTAAAKYSADSSPFEANHAVPEPLNDSASSTNEVDSAQSDTKIATDRYLRPSDSAGTKGFGSYLVEHNLLSAPIVLGAFRQQDAARIHPLSILEKELSLDPFICIGIGEFARVNSIDIFQAAVDLHYMSIVKLGHVRDMHLASRPSLGQTLARAGHASSEDIMEWFSLYLASKINAETPSV